MDSACAICSWRHERFVSFPGTTWLDCTSAKQAWARLPFERKLAGQNWMEHDEERYKHNGIGFENTVDYHSRKTNENQWYCSKWSWTVLL